MLPPMYYDSTGNSPYRNLPGGSPTESQCITGALVGGGVT